jgi:hypothetical protein
VQSVEKPTIKETIRLNRLLVWACTENGRKYNSQKGTIYDLGTRVRGRPRNRWQYVVRED